MARRHDADEKIIEAALRERVLPCGPRWREINVDDQGRRVMRKNGCQQTTYTVSIER
jgi:hypothetical protein